jgi:hypothetical protein
VLAVTPAQTCMLSMPARTAAQIVEAYQAFPWHPYAHKLLVQHHGKLELTRHVTAVMCMQDNHT